jgi:spermidine/putrescine transport system permease protein
MQTNRRQFLLTASAAAAALTVPAYAQKRQTLNIYCWSEYIPQSVIDSFAKANKVKVNVENYASNEEMMAKLSAGAAKYDLIQPSEYIIEELIKAGKLEEITAANVPNLANLDPKFVKMAHDPEGKYCVTWMAGNVGIVVNRTKVKDEIKTYGDVFQDKFKKRIVALDDNRELVSWALASIGKGINDITADNLAAAKPVLAKWLPLVKLYDSDSPKTALLNGDVDLGIVWNGEGAKVLEESKKAKKKKFEFEYIYPAEGGHMFIDSLAIPKGSKNKELAEKFINHVLDAKVSVEVFDEFPYTSPNAAGKKLLKPEQLANPASFPPGDPKLETFKMIPPEMATAIDKLMTDLKNK